MTEQFVDDHHSSTVVNPSGASAVSQSLVQLDEQIRDLVREALDASGYDHLRKLKVYCHNARVTLQGHVTTIYMKEVAKSIVRAVPGVCDIDIDLSVFSRQ